LPTNRPDTLKQGLLGLPFLLADRRRTIHWNQISMGFRLAIPARWALKVSGKFYGMVRPSFSVGATLAETLRERSGRC
jgi:hypothetical protein